MMQLKKILVPTDFSDFSKPAFDYAAALAARFDSELHLFHVLADPTMHIHDPTLISMGAVYERAHEWREITQAELKKVVGDWDNGVPVVCEAANGPPFVEIVRYAKENDIDLIVIGTHGRTGLKHVLIGSVAERVVRKSPCPVLTVRPDGHQFVMP
ncbi:MAG: universal stress protein [Planctomycetaceae bacterium]